jgi:hypothetical protein
MSELVEQPPRPSAADSGRFDAVAHHPVAGTRYYATPVPDATCLFTSSTIALSPTLCANRRDACLLTDPVATPWSTLEH